MKNSHSFDLRADAHWRIAIVHSSFYPHEMRALVDSAQKALVAAGVPKENIADYPVFGSFEIPLLGAAIARAKKADAIIGLGIIVEGETAHAQLIADAAAHGMMDVQTRTQIPFAFEILLVKSVKEAQERLSKGAEAVHAVLTALVALSSL
ncbi:6,7-dimethyl-8-ribityllumazine synthase [Candidatus Peregrinibacteria bacterium]|nr:6,7-dimethyl-8-ribityllumazine synthase [Candidatus Peregrinibacteria bacterium]